MLAFEVCLCCMHVWGMLHMGIILYLCWPTCTCPGKGAYGTVFKATDRSTGEPVAIKVIPLADTDKEELKVC